MYIVISYKLASDEFIESKCIKVFFQVLQLGKMHKYINSDIAITIHNQLNLPLFDYADFRVEYAPKYKVDKSGKLQENTLRYNIENDTCNSIKIENLYLKYEISVIKNLNGIS